MPPRRALPQAPGTLTIDLTGLSSATCATAGMNVCCGDSGALSWRSLCLPRRPWPRTSRVSTGAVSSPSRSRARRAAATTATRGWSPGTSASIIPGNPGSVVTNMTGAGGHLVGRYLSEVAPRDGTWIAAGAARHDHRRALRRQGEAAIRSRQSSSISAAPTARSTCASCAATPASRSLADAQQREVVVGGSRRRRRNARRSPRCSTICSARNSRSCPAIRAPARSSWRVEKGEVSGVCAMSLAAMALQRPQWVASGFIRPIVAEQRAGAAPTLTAQGVPRATDFARSPRGPAGARTDLQPADRSDGRLWWRPGVPPARVAVLRKALRETLQDKDAHGRSREDAARRSIQCRARNCRRWSRSSTPHRRDIITRAADALIYQARRS